MPISPHLRNEGRRHETVRVTEHLATQLLKAYEDRQIQHPIDEQLREELRKPERLVSLLRRREILAAMANTAATRTISGAWRWR